MLVGGRAVSQARALEAKELEAMEGVPDDASGEAGALEAWEAGAWLRVLPSLLKRRPISDEAAKAEIERGPRSRQPKARPRRGCSQPSNPPSSRLSSLVNSQLSNPRSNLLSSLQNNRLSNQPAIQLNNQVSSQLSNRPNSRLSSHQNNLRSSPLSNRASNLPSNRRTFRLSSQLNNHRSNQLSNLLNNLPRYVAF